MSSFFRLIATSSLLLTGGLPFLSIDVEAFSGIVLGYILNIRLILMGENISSSHGWLAPNSINVWNIDQGK